MNLHAATLSSTQKQPIMLAGETLDEYSRLTYREAQRAAKQHGLRANQSRDDLVTSLEMRGWRDLMPGLDNETTTWITDGYMVVRKSVLRQRHAEYLAKADKQIRFCPEASRQKLANEWEKAIAGGYAERVDTVQIVQYRTTCQETSLAVQAIDQLHCIPAWNPFIRCIVGTAEKLYAMVQHGGFGVLVATDYSDRVIGGLVSLDRTNLTIVDE